MCAAISFHMPWQKKWTKLCWAPKRWMGQTACLHQPIMRYPLLETLHLETQRCTVCVDSRHMYASFTPIAHRRQHRRDASAPCAAAVPAFVTEHDQSQLQGCLQYGELLAFQCSRAAAGNAPLCGYQSCRSSQKGVQARFSVRRQPPFTPAHVAMGCQVRRQSSHLNGLSLTSKQRELHATTHTGCTMRGRAGSTHRLQGCHFPAHGSGISVR